MEDKNETMILVDTTLQVHTSYTTLLHRGLLQANML